MDDIRSYIEKIREMTEGRQLRACVTTFGCQMNARDSEKLLAILEQAGYEECSSEEEADLILFNTCTVRDNANQKVYGHLGRLGSIKKKKPHLIIGLCGCMMQEESAREKVIKSYPFVDIIFGTHNIHELAHLLYTRLSEEHMAVSICDEGSGLADDLPAHRKYPFKSGVNISYGCNNFCTYCIVPYVRGRERSRKPQDILEEIKRLSDDGVKEIMLLGQNVNSYGLDLKKQGEDAVFFPELLDKASRVDGIERVRFMTSHPKDLSDELIGVIRDNEKICRHFHLPLQSGSDRLLADMNRRYDSARYLELVEKLRTIPDMCITTDIIVGYPGEQDEDNEATLEVIRRAEFDNAFTFIYSKRTGTPAAMRPDQVPPELVRERFDKVLALVQDMSRKRSALYEGRVMEARAEEVNERMDGYLTGRLSGNSTVHFPGDPSLIGSLVKVRLLESKGFYYMGEAAGNPNVGGRAVNSNVT